jgi:hypothetical protein
MIEGAIFFLRRIEIRRLAGHKVSSMKTSSIRNRLAAPTTNLHYPNSPVRRLIVMAEQPL